MQFKSEIGNNWKHEDRMMHLLSATSTYDRNYVHQMFVPPPQSSSPLFFMINCIISAPNQKRMLLNGTSDLFVVRAAIKACRVVEPTSPFHL